MASATPDFLSLIGLVLATFTWAAYRRVEATLVSLLYGISPGDPTIIAAATLFIATSIVAAWLPAFRAAHVRPVDALRQE